MLTLTDVSFEFGGRFLYQNAGFDLQPTDRIGLVGRNGTGKSTLLKLIAGEYKPTSGTLTRAGGLRVGFLNQDALVYQSEETVFSFAKKGFDALLKLEQEIHDILLKLETDHAERLLYELAEKQQIFEQCGGYVMDAQVSGMLAGLGFANEELHKPLSSFSGGWRMRAFLAQLLLMQPDVLLLDEPTNHLDLPSILWLEGYLARSTAAIMLVSHDRHFLNRVVNRIVEIAHGKLHIYAGDYEFYLKEKELRREQQQAAFVNQQKYIQDNERFIERFKAKASKATQAQSRVKMLDKLERIDSPEADEAVVHFSFQPAVKSGVDVLKMSHINKTYDEGPTILQDATVAVRRGDKIGLIGANGMGKSTVLRILADSEPFVGERGVGHNVMPAFFAQHQLEALNPQHTILQECAHYAYERGETYVRSVLGGFLFTGDDVQKPIRVLSGGERARVALAKTLLSQANFLLLDEPTNHLDLPSIHILAQALQQYTGTYILVSHDRYFLSLVTNKIWYLEDKVVKEYLGSYEEYKAFEEKRLAALSLERSAPKTAQKPVATLPNEAERKAKQRQQTQLRKAEEEVQQLEARQAELQAAMIDPATASDFDKLDKLQKQYDQVQTTLTQATQRWEALYAELEALSI